ncbi:MULTISPECIES: class I SAM-dependent methyltransferase [unclassified Massilia]|uniref:class I SAM-dependent methyltransferase n=1 Tax=unclassified Massilia TaxID=2609279 RepID=UPI001E507A0F|nr:MULTISPECIES: methyltransferase domain-containing protein [unclassified Massilia]
MKKEEEMVLELPAYAIHKSRTSSAAAKSANRILFKEIFKSPRQMGAICPSSRRLANRMAASIDVEADGFVVELGAGTGVVTESLLRRGITPERLIVIEKSALLAAHLSQRFPDVHVLHSDAADIPALLSRNGLVKAVVSSLPLRSLPKHQVDTISLAWAQCLAVHGRVVQFTYAPFRASAWLRAGLRRTAHATEWGNMPPALVEVFSRV